jgi:hypothetical protein
MASGIEEIIHSAYSFIRGTETNKAVASLTLDHLIQQQIDVIRGKGARLLLDAAGAKSGTKPGKLEMLDKIEADINNAVSKIQEAGDDPAKLKALGLEYLAQKDASK